METRCSASAFDIATIALLLQSCFQVGGIRGAHALQPRWRQRAAQLALPGFHTTSLQHAFAIPNSPDMFHDLGNAGPQEKQACLLLRGFIQAWSGLKLARQKLCAG